MPVLLPAHAGAQDTLRQAAVACKSPNLTHKRGFRPLLWPNLECIGGKKSHVARGGVLGNRKKGPREGGGGRPHSWVRGVPTRGGPLPPSRVFFFRQPHTPPRATWDFFSQMHSKFGHKRGLKAPLAVKFVPWQATAPRGCVSCTPAWGTGTRVHPAERSHLARQPTGTVSTPCRKTI